MSTSGVNARANISMCLNSLDSHAHPLLPPFPPPLHPGLMRPTQSPHMPYARTHRSTFASTRTHACRRTVHTRAHTRSRTCGRIRQCTRAPRPLSWASQGYGPHAPPPVVATGPGAGGCEVWPTALQLSWTCPPSAVAQGHERQATYHSPRDGRQARALALGRNQLSTRRAHTRRVTATGGALPAAHLVAGDEQALQRLPRRLHFGDNGLALGAGQ